MLTNGKWAMVAGFVALGGAAKVGAQQKWSYPNCPDVSSADFKKVTLVSQSNDPTLNEPTRMYPAPDGRIFYSERTGKLKIFKPASPGASNGTIVTALTLNVYSGTNTDGSQSESGINGFTLDPDFTNNHYVYIDYAPKTDSIWKMSRFTMNGDKVDSASEKELFRVKTQRIHCCHTGGGMAWDLEGNLWMSLGNNTANPTNNASPTSFIDETTRDGIGDDQGHAANTNDLRGKIIRIHPNPDGSYSIPKGNLFPEGTAKTRPEIYTMGHRNAYTVAVDPYRHWLAWVDVGPDESGETEEHNLVSKPGFMGWPYFVGGLNSHVSSDPNSPTYSYRGGKDPNAPKNTSKWNTGITDLPPANPAILPYKESAAITGPIFHYDGANPSKIKLPPHFDGKWFITDWNIGGGYLKVVTLNEAGTAVTDNRMLLGNATLVGPIDLKIGPDGALYVLEYGGSYFATTNATKLSRYEYTGSCLPPTPTLPTAIHEKGIVNTRSGLISSLSLGLARVVDVPMAAKSFAVFDIHGKRVWEYRVEGQYHVALPTTLGNGLYQVKFQY
jgi:cytochrome c